VTGPDLGHLAMELRKQSGVKQAVIFGSRLHVSSDDPQALEAAIAPFRKEPYEWSQIHAGLEDAFIHLMEHSTDNFTP